MALCSVVRGSDKAPGARGVTVQPKVDQKMPE